MNVLLLDAKVRRLDAEARPVFERLALAVREASDDDSGLIRHAHVAVLCAADALSAHPRATHEQRWRRLVRTIEPLARRGSSDVLRALVDENRDLLQRSNQQLNNGRKSAKG